MVAAPMTPVGPKRNLPPERGRRSTDEFPGLENLDRPELDEVPEGAEGALEEDWADWEDVSQYRERGSSGRLASG
jgi:hypothetical protein